MSGVTSPVNSVTFEGAVQEWTVCPSVFAPEKREKVVPPTSSEGREVFTTPQGFVSAPRGHGSPYAPIQIIISYFAFTVSFAIDESGSTNMS